MLKEAMNVYVILGATGKIGRATTERLRGRGAVVRAVARDALKAKDLAALGCDIAVADLHDASALRKAIKGATTVEVICPTSVREKDAASDMKTIIDAVGESNDRARSA